MLLLLVATNVFAQAEDGVGQTIRINTRLRSFIGRPSWLLVIRDIDHNQNIPYVFDVNQNDNFWLAFTYGHSYVIVASTMQFAPYKANPFRTRVIHNFCNLESRGRISRGESMQVTINGDLSPNTDNYTCSVMRFRDSHFNVPAAD